MRVLFLVLVFAAGCAGSASLVPPDGWSHTLGRDHRLIGRIWSAEQRGFVGPDELGARVERAGFLLLGETHDNADHHRLQARLLERWLEAHPDGAVAFEMLDDGQAQALAGVSTADELATRVRWDDSGWPEFAIYRPVFEVVLARRAPILAAHPSRDRVRASMHGVSDDEARELRLAPPLAGAERQALEEEIRTGHCGHASPGMVDGMVQAQTFLDAWMARVMAQAGRPVALVAGRGHVLSDRAVPNYLRRWTDEEIVSVGFVDVDDSARDAADYAGEHHDFTVFTPRVTDESPCDRFRRALEQMRAD